MRPGCTTSVRPNTNLAMKQKQKLNYIYASITFFTTFSKLFTIFIDFHFYFFLSLFYKLYPAGMAVIRMCNGFAWVDENEDEPQ